ncbi:MAG TPA: lipocalin-like domain-containing protein [Gemmatimonadaceae bacterium]|nr:lipocalin-like domain-containing protein [Gemmatimonadaceae bacterium]
MTNRRLFCVACAIATVAAPVRAQSVPAQSPIVGTWLLDSIVDTLQNGSVSYWMGRRPTGAIIYSASGHMSVQFMRDPRPVLPERTDSGSNVARLAGADPFAALEVDQLRDLFGGYYAYFGRYQVSAAGDSIAHFVETSLRPDEVGVTYRRDSNRRRAAIHRSSSGGKRRPPPSSAYLETSTIERMIRTTAAA